MVEYYTVEFDDEYFNGAYWDKYGHHFKEFAAAITAYTAAKAFGGPRSRGMGIYKYTREEILP
jgi:hypothetical protein